MRTRSALLLTTTALLISAALMPPAFADEWRHGGGGERDFRERDFHDRDFHDRDFHDHAFSNHWHEGRWFNGFHEGRNGWWWILDGGWYFYPAPIYPYPDPYTPPTVVVETFDSTPAPTGTQVYYYCQSPAGYYPQVPQCSVTWQRVVSAPTAASPAPAATVMAPAGDPQGLDQQQLDIFESKLRHIDLNDGHARAKLKDLGKQIESFRESLYKREYNAMGILKDSEELKKRVDARRAGLSKRTTLSSPQ